MEPIKQWVICVSGFLQKRGSGGMSRLWRCVHQDVADCYTVVHPMTWNDSPSAIAEFISRYADVSQPPCVVIAGYSWGGHTAIKVCRELQSRGNLKIEHLVLSDAIYRPWFVLGRWRSLLRWPGQTLKVPPNVARVTVFRQKRNRPSGHRVSAINSRKTKITYTGYSPLTHQEMDDDRVFHKVVRWASRTAHDTVAHGHTNLNWYEWARQAERKKANDN